jgi:hypothetical protein
MSIFTVKIWHYILFKNSFNNQNATVIEKTYTQL